MRAAASRRFRDLRAGVVREEGEEFELSEERFAELSRKLPGYVEEAAEAPQEDASGAAAGLSASSTKAELLAFAEGNGVEVAASSTKAELLAALRGAGLL